MSTIHLHQTTTSTPEQFVAGLTDFGPDRHFVATEWPLHGIGSGRGRPFAQREGGRRQATRRRRDRPHITRTR
jgi:hypothetical protein